MEIERVAWTALPGHLPPAALAYLAEYERMADRLPVDWRDGRALADRARRVAASGMDPEAAQRVGEVLASLSAPPQVVENLERLRRGKAAAIVTGQQPGIALGPLYNLYKAITVIRRARMLEEAGVPAVPVFWNHSDDHSAGELGRIRFPDGRGGLAEAKLALPDNRVPLCDRPLTGLPPFLDRLRTLLPISAHRDGVMDLVAEAARGTVSQWFTRLLLALLGKHGLVVVEPRDLVGERAREVFRRALAEEGLVDRALEAGGAALRARGLPATLRGPFGSNVYVVEGGTRRRAGLGARGRLSAGVALRLILQDSVLPVAAYVAGPNEIAYLAQLTELYAAYGMSPPAVLPRISATLADGSAAGPPATVGGALQERVVSPLHAMVTHGPAVVERLLDGLQSDPGDHQVVRL